MFFAVIVLMILGIDGVPYPTELHSAPRYETRAECMEKATEVVQEALPMTQYVAGYSVQCVRLPQV